MYNFSTGIKNGNEKKWKFENALIKNCNENSGEGESVRYIYDIYTKFLYKFND